MTLIIVLTPAATETTAVVHSYKINILVWRSVTFSIPSTHVSLSKKSESFSYPESLFLLVNKRTVCSLHSHFRFRFPRIVVFKSFVVVSPCLGQHRSARDSGLRKIYLRSTLVTELHGLIQLETQRLKSGWLAATINSTPWGFTFLQTTPTRFPRWLWRHHPCVR